MPFAEVHQLALIFGLFALHLVVPGPNMLYICASASRGGRAEAVGFAVGTALGTTFWAAFVTFGAWHVVADRSLLTEGLRLLVGIALIVVGGQALLAAFSNACLKVAERRCNPSRAVLQGLLVTLANGNEIVFWGAVLVLGAEVEHGSAFGLILVVGVGLISLAFDVTLACLASGGEIGRFMLRMRRVLELGLGSAFCATGAILLRLV